MSEQALALANPQYFQATVTDRPSQVEASAIAATLAHELAHILLGRYYEKDEPDRYHRIQWNLTHYACLHPLGRTEYLYRKKLLRSLPVMGFQVTMAVVDIAKLVRDQPRLTFPHPDGVYFV